MKISAIIPVYNSEKYIGRCIDSVIAQTYLDWELILVDDGSTDNSLIILKEYEKRDSRIKVVHQSNAGPGIARNTGISHVSGKYTVFVDSDDRINKDYFKLLSEKDEDLVFIDINQVDESFNVIKKEYMSDYEHLPKDIFLRQQMTGKINWGGVRKAIKTSLLLNNSIRFAEFKIGEEAVYSFLILLNAKSFSFIRKPVYEYVNREGSQSCIPMDDPWGEVTIALKEKILELNLYDDYANTLNAFITTAAIVSLNNMAQKYEYRYFRKQAKTCLEKYKASIDIKYRIDYRSLKYKALILYPFLKMRWVTPIYIISYLNNQLLGLH